MGCVFKHSPMCRSYYCRNINRAVPTYLIKYFLLMYNCLAYLTITSRIQQRTRQEAPKRTAPTSTRGLMISTESKEEWCSAITMQWFWRPDLCRLCILWPGWPLSWTSGTRWSADRPAAGSQSGAWSGLSDPGSLLSWKWRVSRL